MKIGIYSLYRCCKSKKTLIACGKTPCAALAIQIFLLVGLIGFVMMFTIMNYPPKVWAAVIVINLFYASCFMRICLAEPGIPPKIIEKWR